MMVLDRTSAIGDFILKYNKMKKLLILCILLSGCADSNNITKLSDSNTYKIANGYCTLDTIEYENHKWIIGRTHGGMVLQHHPDCKCKK